MPLKSYKICSKIFEHGNDPLLFFERCSKKLRIWYMRAPLRFGSLFDKGSRYLLLLVENSSEGDTMRRDTRPSWYTLLLVDLQLMMVGSVWQWCFLIINTWILCLHWWGLANYDWENCGSSCLLSPASTHTSPTIFTVRKDVAQHVTL